VERESLIRVSLEQNISPCPVHGDQCPEAEPPPFLVTSINSAGGVSI
jgi:hypothetical protein